MRLDQFWKQKQCAKQVVDLSKLRLRQDHRTPCGGFCETQETGVLGTDRRRDKQAVHSRLWTGLCPLQHKYSWKPSTNTIENPEQIQSNFQWCKSRPCVTKQQWYFFNKTPDNGVGCVEISTRLGIQYKYNWKCNTNTMESAQQIYYKSTLNPVIVLWQNLQLHCSEIMLVNHSDHNRPLYGWKARNLQAEVLCKYKWKSGGNTRENAVKQ